MEKEIKYYLFFKDEFNNNKTHKVEFEKLDFSQTDGFVFEYEKNKFISFSSYKVTQNISKSNKEFILQPVGFWSLSESNEYNI